MTAAMTEPMTRAPGSDDGGGRGHVAQEERTATAAAGTQAVPQVLARRDHQRR